MSGGDLVISWEAEEGKKNIVKQPETKVEEKRQYCDILFSTPYFAYLGKTTFKPLETNTYMISAYYEPFY